MKVLDMFSLMESVKSCNESMNLLRKRFSINKKCRTVQQYNMINFILMIYLMTDENVRNVKGCLRHFVLKVSRIYINRLYNVI